MVRILSIFYSQYYFLILFSIHSNSLHMLILCQQIAFVGEFLQWITSQSVTLAVNCQYSILVEFCTLDMVFRWYSACLSEMSSDSSKNYSWNWEYIFLEQKLRIFLNKFWKTLVSSLYSIHTNIEYWTLNMIHHSPSQDQ